jgi:ribosomal protein S18 acetylase RimI-like enzyme
LVAYTEAKKEDGQEIIDLVKTNWIRTYSLNYPIQDLEKMYAKWHTILSMEKDIASRNKKVLVAKVNSKIVGVCVGEYLKTKKELNIAKLHIQSEFQGQGIGKNLMERMTKVFSPVEKITLEVEVNNQKAIQFYKKIGFIEVGTVSYTTGKLSMKCIEMESYLHSGTEKE